MAAWWPRRASITTLAISNIKKTGKTWLNAVITAWRWLAFPGLHYAAANDLDQAAGRQFLMIADMVKRNKFLSANCQVTGKYLVFNPTGSRLEALASDAASNAGANHLTASHTEAWGIQYEASIRAWEELTTPPGKVYGLPALRIVDSYAGYEGESQTWHDVVDRGLEGELVSSEWPIYQAGGLLLFHATGEEAQRTCFRGTREEARIYYHEQAASLRENAYKRLHENQRTANVGDFVDPAEWEACISKELHPLAAGSKQAVYIGLDLAVAPGGDNCALVGVYEQAGRAVLAFHKVWKGGKFRIKSLSLLDEVAPYIIQLHSTYNVQGVYFDPWQAIALTEHLRKHGIYCQEVTQTHKSRGPKDTALYEMILSRRLVVYDHPDLRSLAGNASAKTLPDGRLFLQKAGRGKIDLLVAISNVADLAGDGRANEITAVADPFANWPPPEGAEFHQEQGWVTGWNHKPHPEGVTWRTCRHRARGCYACEAELKAEGVFDGLAYDREFWKSTGDTRPEPYKQSMGDVDLSLIHI